MIQSAWGQGKPSRKAHGQAVGEQAHPGPRAGRNQARAELQEGLGTSCSLGAFLLTPIAQQSLEKKDKQVSAARSL